ncbi:MAG: UTP--glucose-1-phosphate uridylyltransferase [Alphaproteobacteria bacterium]|nr:UTP--glucose-1-phosphate uridylyltransferase [Alphaproteobacteria bacterium]
MGHIRTAVFPVAGLGTRFLPATKAIPKEMMIVGDKPLIQHAVEEAIFCGVERFIFVTSANKPSIAAHFDYNHELEQHLVIKGKHETLEAVRACTLEPGQAVFTYQQKPLGLGHAVACSIPWLQPSEPFAVILPDDYIQANTPCLKQMCDAYFGGIMVAAKEVPLHHAQSYGILAIHEKKGNLIHAKDVVEKPHPDDAPSRYAVIGRYILPYSIIPSLQSLMPGTGGELQLTDALRSNHIDHKAPFLGCVFEGERFDCGSKEGWLQANSMFS